MLEPCIYTLMQSTHTYKKQRADLSRPPTVFPYSEILLLYSLCQTLEWGDVVEVCTLNYVGPNRYANYLIYPPILYNLLLDVYTLSIIFLILSPIKKIPIAHSGGERIWTLESGNVQPQVMASFHQTNKQTNKHRLQFYIYIQIDIYIYNIYLHYISSFNNNIQIIFVWIYIYIYRQIYIYKYI